MLVRYTSHGESCFSINDEDHSSEARAGSDSDPVKTVKIVIDRFNIIAAALLLMGLTACNKDADRVDRWYSQQQVVIGAKVFANRCASCHGQQAEGLGENWKARLEDGSLSPPPLNGSAHAWHHPLPLLLQIVQQGGALYGGKMPGFGSILSEAEQYAVISWFQSLWSDDIYLLWSKSEESLLQKGVKHDD